MSYFYDLSGVDLLPDQKVTLNTIKNQFVEKPLTYDEKNHLVCRCLKCRSTIFWSSRSDYDFKNQTPRYFEILGWFDNSRVEIPRSCIQGKLNCQKFISRVETPASIACLNYPRQLDDRVRKSNHC